LIEQGQYEWPYIGVRGDSVNRLIANANGLDTQFGAYIQEVIQGGPADQAGLQGSTGTDSVDGVPIPVGGDVVIEADGEQIRSFSDLLVHVAYQNVGDQIQLTVLRNGEQRSVTLTLAARPGQSSP
jgi:S1-C subfamily serine protease